MATMQVLKSAQDESVNFVFSGDHPGVFESRYVRRSPEYPAVYLSSQSGCVQACRFCHLTTTGQTKFVNARIDDYLAQAGHVLDWYDKQLKDGKCAKARCVHYNFMARGEPLDNPYLLQDGKNLFEILGEGAMKRDLFPRFLISSIFPKSFAGQSLSKTFPVINPEIYYSIYSVREQFRKRWMPRAMPVNEALTILREYQEDTKKIIKLHWAFIEGENDSAEDVEALCKTVRESGVRADFAIVRYNPYSEKYGREPNEEVVMRRAKEIGEMMPFSKVKVITRVGFDVKASCGMFVTAQQ